MLTKTVEHAGYTVVLRTQTRLSSLMRAVYRRAFVRRYPQLRDVLEAQSQEQVEAAVNALSDDTLQLYTLVLDFIVSAQNVQRASGFPFVWPEVGELPSDTQIADMYAHYLTDSDGIWQEIIQAWVELMTPLAPSEQLALPPNLEDVDPNASAPIGNGNSESSATFAPLPNDGRSASSENLTENASPALASDDTPGNRSKRSIGRGKPATTALP